MLGGVRTTPFAGLILSIFKLGFSKETDHLSVRASNSKGAQRVLAKASRKGLRKGFPRNRFSIITLFRSSLNKVFGL